MMSFSQLATWPFKDDEEQKKITSEEESIVFSLAMSFTNRMICLRVPIDAFHQMEKYKERRKKKEQALRRLNNTGNCNIFFFKYWR